MVSHIFSKTLSKKEQNLLEKINVVLIYSQYWTLENHLSIMI